MRSPLDRTALVLIIIGALNWLSVGLFRYDLVGAMFGPTSIVTRAIFVIVGIAGLYSISLIFRENDEVVRGEH